MPKNGSMQIRCCCCHAKRLSLYVSSILDISPVITWPRFGGLDSAWFAVRATAVYSRYSNIASSPCVKKCQSNSYLTSFWPEGIFKNLFKMLPAKYFNWTIEKVCPPTLSSGPECPVHYGVWQYWHRCLNIKLCCIIFGKTLTREAFSLPEICSNTLTFKNPLKHYCEQLYKWV